MIDQSSFRDRTQAIGLIDPEKKWYTEAPSDRFVRFMQQYPRRYSKAFRHLSYAMYEELQDRIEARAAYDRIERVPRPK